jgi:hypothetical protein
MNKREWWRSIFLIAALLAAAILVAQSRRNCEIPGSSFVPCIWGEATQDPLRVRTCLYNYRLYAVSGGLPNEANCCVAVGGLKGQSRSRGTVPHPSVGMLSPLALGNAWLTIFCRPQARNLSFPTTTVES